MEELKSYQNYVHENILDPLHDNLSSEIWDENNKLKQKVRNFIIDKYEKFAKQIKLDLKITEFVIVGSLTGFSYGDETDLDVHIEYDTNDKERIKRLRKIAPNGDLIPGTKHPLNYYFMYKGEQPESNYRGIYDVLEDKWIKKDKKEEIDPMEFWKAATTQAISWGRKIMLDIDELRRDMLELKMYRHFLEIKDAKVDKDYIERQINRKEEEIKADYDVLVMNPHVMKAFRKEAHEGEKFDSLTFPKDVPEQADYSLNNVVYKILEKLKYWELASKIKQKAEEEFPELIQK